LSIFKVLFNVDSISQDIETVCSLSSKKVYRVFRCLLL